MKSSDFVIAAGALIISTRFNLSQHQELLKSWNLPSLIVNNPLISTILAPLYDNPGPASELSTFIFNCIPAGLLAWIYDIGRHEELHASMFLLTFAASVFAWIKLAFPVDIYLFVVFPWMLLVGLLISRIHDNTREMKDGGFASEKKLNSSFVGLYQGFG